MNEKISNKNIGLVDYKELESNILSSIREGRSLTGKGGALTPLIKKLLEASLEGEIESHLSSDDEIAEMVKVQKLYIRIQAHLSL